MFFDAITIAAARDEFLESLCPGRVQQVRAVGPLAIALEIYSNQRRRHLLISAHAQYARAQLLATPPSRDPGVRTPFLLLLRKYIRGAVLQSIEQPEMERVLVFTFTKVLPTDERNAAEWEQEEGAETGDDPRADIPPGFALFETRIVAEIMGRHSNIVLVGGDDEILDAVKRIPPSLNRVRTTLPHQPYVAPPAQRKLNLLTMGEKSFELELQSMKADAALVGALVGQFRAVSPLLAAEAVFRAGGNAASRVGDVAPAALHRELTALLELAETAEWDPSLAWAVEPDTDEPETEDEESQEPRASSRKPLAFAPYPLRHLTTGQGQLQALASISRAAELFYAALEQVSGHAQLKSDVMAELKDRADKVERRLRSLRGEMERAKGFEDLRHRAELLMAYMYGVTPGQKELQIPDENITIALDPDLTPLEQAQQMFRRYGRARDAVAGVPARIESSELELRYIDELMTALDVANDYDAIGAVRADLAAMPAEWGADAATGAGSRDGSREPGAGKAERGKQDRREAQRGGKGARRNTDTKTTAPGARQGMRPVQVRSKDGITLLYGRSARENDALTFGVAQPHDLWLHARGVPGSHVVIRSEGRAIPESTVAEAARLAARNSKARNDGAVDVIVTERRHVRRIPGAPPGLVTYSDERVLRVRVNGADHE